METGLKYAPQIFTVFLLLFNTCSAYFARQELNYKLEQFFLKLECSQLKIASESKDFFYRGFARLELKFETLTQLTNSKFNQIREEQSTFTKELQKGFYDFTLASQNRPEHGSKLEAFTSQSKIEAVTSTLDYALQLGMASAKLACFLVVVGGCVYGAYHSYTFLNTMSEEVLRQPGLLVLLARHL